jgi:hypothetical protein
MTKDTLAALVHGRRHDHGLSIALTEGAKEAGLVIVMGGGEDYIELHGALEQEWGVYGAAEILLTREGIFDTHECGEPCRYFTAALKHAQRCGQTLRVVWNATTFPTWHFQTTIPHATFDILEEGQVFCRGIVFHLDDIERRSQS